MGVTALCLLLSYQDAAHMIMGANFKCLVFSNSPASVRSKQRRHNSTKVGA